MGTKKIYSRLLDFKVSRKDESKLVVKGRHGRPVSDLFRRLSVMKKNEQIVVSGDGQQRLIARRLRNNVVKWKQRKGFAHVAVHLRSDGNIAVYFE